MVAALGFWGVLRVSLAQTPGDVVITKRLNSANNVVRVGDRLDFTITVTNQSAFTLTQIRLIDTFDSTILQFVEAIPPASSQATGSVIWDNIAVLNSPAGMLPNDTLTFTLSFIATRPETAVVNRVEGRDVIREGGGAGAGAEDQDQADDVARARTILVKRAVPPQGGPQAGLPITFTHLITNDSGAFLVQLPLTDTYDPAFLTFKSALPPPDVITPGQLIWTNLVAYFGPITPDSRVVITTVFTASTEVLTTVNRAETGRVVDEFGNDATGDVAEVPITIIGDAPTPTVTPVIVYVDDDDDGEDVAVAPTPTPLPAVAPATGPGVSETSITTTEQIETTTARYLPETGYYPARSPIFPVVIIVVLLAGSWLLKRSD